MAQANENAVYTTNYSSSMFRALDTHEISAGNPSMEDSLSDYLTYGVADAVVSAGVGLYNTGAALGQVIGIAGDDAMLDEGDTINSLLGADAASFYGRHKTGIDVTGLVVGSLVPGLAAIRGLRMLQTAGKVSTALEGATGLRNADIVMNSVAVESAKKYALETTTAAPNWFSTPMIKAYAQGYKQQVMEAGAFEAATLVTMNQQATLNPDDLSYFDAISNQFWDATKFAAFGGVLGGSIDALRIFGGVRKHINDEWTRAAPLNEVNLGYSTGTLDGNKLLELGREAERRAELEKTIEPTDWFGRRQFEAGQNILKSAMLDIFANVNKAGTEGYNVLEGMVKEAGSENLASMATVLSGLKNIENVSVKDFEELRSFYSKTRTPSMIVSESNPNMMAEAFAQEQYDFLRVMQKFTGEGPSPDMDKIGDHFAILTDRKSAGFALPGGKLRTMEGTDFRARVVKSKASGDALMIVPDFIGLNPTNIDTAYQVNRIYAGRTGQPFDFTPEAFSNYVLLHEMGHIKNNTSKLKTMVANNIENVVANTEGKKIVEELLTASLRGREPEWFMTQGGKFNELPESAKVELLMKKLTQRETYDERFEYLADPAELLADGAAYMTNPATRELGSKHFPTLAKLFNEEGAIAKAWNPTKAFYNSRTKEVYSSYLPGIADVDQNLKVTVKGMDVKLVSPALNKSFTLRPDLFQKEALEAAIKAKGEDLVMDYDAQWIMADRMSIDDIRTPEGLINVAENNLPVMEKLHQLYTSGNIMVRDAFEKGMVRLNGQVVTAQALPELVKTTKEDIRRLLATSEVGYNEQEIARMLNIDMPQAMGVADAPSEGWMLLGRKDYTKPEVFTMKYEHRNMADYQGAVMNMTGVSVANDAVKSQNEATAALLLGQDISKLPEIHDDLVRTVTPASSRATLTANLRTEVGSLREKAAYVGKLVQQKLLNTVEEVDKGYASFASVFNRKENAALRFELANVDNILRREHYYHVTSDSGQNYVVRKDVFQGMTKSMFGDFHPDTLVGMPDDMITGLVGSGDKWAPDALKLSDEVSSFYQSHSAKNASIVDRKIEVAKARGVHSTLDPHVLYAPPRDLSKQKYFGLIEPSVFKKGSDNRHFMIYAETAQELEAKKLAIQNKYGNEYKVDTTRERMELFRAGKTQGDGDVFDELDFDATLFRKGSSSELAPNVDLTTSSTLERYRTWTIKQEETLIRAGVELKYQPVVDKLKRFDREFGKQEENTLNKRWQESSTIWKDTLSTMLNKRARGSALEQEFVRVNDYLGERGSKFLESSFSAFRKGNKDAPITTEELLAWNQKLDEAGYKSPFDNVAEVLLSSPETTQSQLFPSMVKTLSKLVSTFMLGLDPANSMMQLLSTPILTLPVLMEAKRALKGQEAEARLAGATTVVNPATGVREPTSAKLLATATTKFWTPEGKEFMKGLRDRNIITDELLRYHDVLDMSELNGRHTMKQVNDKLDKLAKYGSYFSQRNFSEAYSRFVTAWAVKDLAEIRGLPAEETWALVSGSVDKVHGIYAGAQRPQLFQGVLGQSVGLYQTYFFNFAQSIMRSVADGNKAQAAIAMGMQTSLFGIQSLPGFQALNAHIGNSNRNKEDLYTYTNADSGESYGQYAMYGMASHMFGTPIDFSTRGSLTSRNMLLIPTQFQDLPIVGTLSKAIGNIVDTGMMAADGNVGVGNALIHGLAHNSMNRPLQGIASIMAGRTSTMSGQLNQGNINRLGYEENSDLNWGAMFARAIGTRPLNETIVQNAYFRNAEYKANTNRELGELGGKIQISASAGKIDALQYKDFAREYEMAGGEIQSFNAYFGRQLKQASTGTMDKFRQEMQMEHASEIGRASYRMMQKQSTTTPWELEQ